MSWDIIVQDVPSDAQSVDEIPDDFAPKLIGSRSHIIKSIKEVVPFVVFTDPAYGIIDGPDYSIEINLGNDKELMSFSFVVRGGGVAPGIVAEILQHLKLRAFDTNTGEFFNAATAQASFKQWQAYRDWVVNEDRKQL